MGVIRNWLFARRRQRQSHVTRYSHGRSYSLFTLDVVGKAPNKKDLERFLRDRGIVHTGRKEEQLVLAAESDFDVDPDGINADIHECNHSSDSCNLLRIAVTV